MTDKPITSRDLIRACGGDPDAPFEVGPFPPEMRQRADGTRLTDKPMTEQSPADVPVSEAAFELVARYYAAKAFGSDKQTELAALRNRYDEGRVDPLLFLVDQFERDTLARQQADVEVLLEAQVERIAELQLAAFLAGRGSLRKEKPNGEPSMDDWRHFARTALASVSPVSGGEGLTHAGDQGSFGG